VEEKCRFHMGGAPAQENSDARGMWRSRKKGIGSEVVGPLAGDGRVVFKKGGIDFVLTV